MIYVILERYFDAEYEEHWKLYNDNYYTRLEEATSVMEQAIADAQEDWYDLELIVKELTKA